MTRLPYLALALVMLWQFGDILDHRATATMFKRQAQSPAQSLAVPVAFKIQDVKFNQYMKPIAARELRK